MPSYTMTIIHDDHITEVAASPGTTVSTAKIVKLTPTFASNYELKDIKELTNGNVQINVAEQTVILSKNCTIAVTSKLKDKYMVTERCSVCVNHKLTELMPNTEVVVTPNGAAKGMKKMSANGKLILMNDAVQSLIDQGILVKI